MDTGNNDGDGNGRSNNLDRKDGTIGGMDSSLRRNKCTDTPHKRLRIRLPALAAQRRNHHPSSIQSQAQRGPETLS